MIVQLPAQRRRDAPVRRAATPQELYLKEQRAMEINPLRNASIVLAVMILVGCNGFPGGSNYGITGTEVHVGTEGISLEFVEGTIPAEIYEDEIVAIPIIIENKGA